MSATTIDRTTGRDGLLRLAMRADAAISGLVGLAGIPLVGWLAEVSGTTTAFEYGMSAFLIGYGVLVFGLAALPRCAAPAWPSSSATCFTPRPPWCWCSPTCSR